MQSFKQLARKLEHVDLDIAQCLPILLGRAEFRHISLKRLTHLADQPDVFPQTVSAYPLDRRVQDTDAIDAEKFHRNHDAVNRLAKIQSRLDVAQLAEFRMSLHK